MLLPIENLEIRWAIVFFVTIFMMYLLFSFKTSTYFICHNKSMFSQLSIFVRHWVIGKIDKYISINYMFMSYESFCSMFPKTMLGTKYSSFLFWFKWLFAKFAGFIFLPVMLSGNSKITMTNPTRLMCRTQSLWFGMYGFSFTSFNRASIHAFIIPFAMVFEKYWCIS